MLHGGGSELSDKGEVVTGPCDSVGMDGMTTRVLSRAEVKAYRGELFALLDEAIRDSPLAEVRENHLYLAQGDFERAATYDSYHAIIAEDEERSVAGFVIGVVYPDSARLPGTVEAAHPGFAAGALLVVWVAVRPKWRRRGIATRLLDHLLDAIDVPRVWGFVDPANVPSKQMFKQRGWYQLGTHKGQLVLGRAVGRMPHG